MAARRNPHAVFIPFPAQSHIKAHLKLAKLLHHRGFHITFVNTEFNHKRFLKTQGSDSLRGFPGFRFEAIPDGLPPDDTLDASQDLTALVNSLKQNYMAAPFMELLKNLNDSASSSGSDSVIPPVSCIFSDANMIFTLDVARELGIPNIIFFTISASALLCLNYYRELKERGLTQLKDESNMDTVIDWIPGMKDFRFRNLPSFVRTIDQDELMVNHAMEIGDRIVDATAIIVETFDALEPEVLDSLRSMYCPQIYTIAPLELLLKQIPQDQHPLESYSLWKEEKECLEWLDKQETKSVLYVNFGSIVTVEPNQLVEFAMGLVKSNHPFLWIIRPDLVEGEKAVLPNEFAETIKEQRGFAASWCDQEEVLNHPSIGGFVTHCGWNSTVESLTAGVPMICYPCYGDQQTNSWLACRELGVGFEVEMGAKSEDIEKMVNELMEEGKGKKMKEKAVEWRSLAHEAAGQKGSSSANLDKLVKELTTLV